MTQSTIGGSQFTIPEGIQRFIHAVKAHVPDGFIEMFNKAPDDEERAHMIWSQPSLHDVVMLEPEYCAKSSTEASKYRQSGNKYFQKKAYLSAIGEYNKSIINAPRESTIASENELCLAFANRSAALFHFNKFELSLRDIEFAFEHGYPEDLQYKLYDRQGKCFLQLGRKTQALESFAKAEESLQSAKMEEKYLAIWKANLQKEVAKCEKMTESSKSFGQDDGKRKVAPKLGKKANEKYPSASEAVDICYKEKDGRHAVASDDIHVGEVLMVEKPFASVLYPEYQSTHCYHCFQKALAPIPCPESSSIMFCSKECRSQAWDTYHKYEYQYAAVLDKSLCGKTGHLALRLLMEAGIRNALDLVSSLENKGDLKEGLAKVGINKEGVYAGGFESIYHMMAHTDVRKPDDLFDLAVMACFLLKIAQASGFLKQGEGNYDKDDNLKILGGILLRNLQVIQCNAKSVIEIHNPDNFHEPKPVDLGIAIYPTAALLNHSCDPIVDLSYYGNSVVVRAIQNVAKNSAISCSYGLTFYDDEEVTRRTKLALTYFFDCQCVPCVEGWPLWLAMDNQHPEWLCLACGNILLSDKLEEKKYAKCKKCKHRQNLEEMINNLGASHDVYSQAMGEALSGHHENALPGLVSHFTLLQKCINQPWRDFTACQVAIKHCFRMMANCVDK